MTAQPTTRWIAGNGVDLALHDWGGNGQPLLVLHGNSYHGRVWDEVLRPLLPNFRPMALDWRGHGDSEAPPPPYSSEVFQADLKAVIENLGIDRPNILAHSLGAVTSLMVAGRYHTTGRILAIEPVMRPRGSTSEGVEKGPLTNRIFETAKRRRANFPDRETIIEGWKDRPPFNTWELQVLRDYVNFGFRDLPDGSVELKCAGMVEAEIYVHGIPLNPWEHLPNVSVPTLIFRGQSSPLFHQGIVDELGLAMPNTDVRTIPGTTHSVPMERPGLVVDAVREWFTTP